MRIVTNGVAITIDPTQGSVQLAYADGSASVLVYLNEDDYTPMIMALANMHEVCYPEMQWVDVLAAQHPEKDSAV